MNQVLSAIHDRHSTRAFTAQQVSRADLETILEAGLWAPTGMGKQLWHFSAIRNAEKCLELAHAVADADNRGPAYNFYGAPCHIIVSYKRDEIHAFPDGSAAIQTMLLAAQSLGISSCWINQLRPLTDHASIRPCSPATVCPKTISLSVRLRSVMPMNRLPPRRTSAKPM